jgi:hypothetical protein
MKEDSLQEEGTRPLFGHTARGQEAEAYYMARGSISSVKLAKVPFHLNLTLVGCSSIQMQRDDSFFS